ncbi:fructose-1,6-bisphosphatase [Thomasclavelia ramosa]|uniref:fructose-1,6-bisphosphatase n=1 Tax=Thomasclavelia ramosa TaxID=1547 RepID=UPI0022DF56BB|nr:fructose-1,6-bisphosphatase [Thomasclavelia ramosa]
MENDLYRHKYLQLLSDKYQSIQDTCTEIINLQAIMSLPKGTEHFMSDLHGEYEAFYHILNNCSGVIKEKVDLLFKQTLKKAERQELCALIYYPDEKLKLLKQEQKDNREWYLITLNRLIELTSLLSSKYTRSKVRKALPKQFGYIIDELLHSKDSKDNNIKAYHGNILDTIINIDNGDAFIKELVELIKRLAVDHLHIVGDIFDRGARADSIIDLLINYHSLDIQWGNHDILWMGAASGNKACVATVIYNNLRYNNHAILENGYGISLRNLISFANELYGDYDNVIDPVIKTIAIIMFKLEGNIIKRNPEYMMNERLFLDKLNLVDGKVMIGEHSYPLKDNLLLTINSNNPYQLTKRENEIIDELTNSFMNSIRLKKHLDFLCNKGAVYRTYNNNLIYHGCMPLTQDGNFQAVKVLGKVVQGKAYFDFVDEVVRKVINDQVNYQYIDLMYFLWCNLLSPFSGRVCKTFERLFIEDSSAHQEPTNYYYEYYNNEKECNMILHEFGLYSNRTHIINGHLPIKVKDGENPLKANGKLIMIDGGFCKAYHEKTGIAGYTLIYNSHGMRIKAHSSFASKEKVFYENKDIISESKIIETTNERLMVRDTDAGKQLKRLVDDLMNLLILYKNNRI